MEEDEGEEIVETIPAVRARPVDYVVALLVFLTSVAQEVTDFFEMVLGITAKHANYQNNQAKFADEIRLEIENVPTTEE